MTRAAHFEKADESVRAIYDRLLATVGTHGPVTEDVKKTSIHLVRRTAFDVAIYAPAAPEVGFVPAAQLDAAKLEPLAKLFLSRRSSSRTPSSRASSRAAARSSWAVGSRRS